MLLNIHMRTIYTKGKNEHTYKFKLQASKDDNNFIDLTDEIFPAENITNHATENNKIHYETKRYVISKNIDEYLTYKIIGQGYDPDFGANYWTMVIEEIQFYGR